MKKITYCIPSKNNLRYLKHCIKSIKDNSSVDYDIIVYIDADTDGTENWLVENNITYLKNITDVPKGIAYGYNRCIESVLTDIVCMFHADMYMGKYFDTNILKHLTPGKVVSGTRIEPPLHPEGKEKIVMNFGMYPEDFDVINFTKFVEYEQVQSKDLTTKGIFAPWAIYTTDIISIGMHDDELHSYYEDSDIFNRFILSGYDILQPRDALVYHLTCRGGQFQDGIEHITNDICFHNMKQISSKHYIRKWGTWIKNDEYQYPILSKKYNITAVVLNGYEHILELLEPWCHKVYMQTDLPEIMYRYYNTEQPNTSFNLLTRIFNLDLDDANHSEDDIILEFNANNFTQQSFNIIQNLSDIITDSGEVGTFQLDCFTIKINRMVDYSKELIYCKS